MKKANNNIFNKIKILYKNRKKKIAIILRAARVSKYPEDSLTTMNMIKKIKIKIKLKFRQKDLILKRNQKNYNNLLLMIIV